MERRALVPYARVKDVQRSVALYGKRGFTIANQHAENVPNPIWVWLNAGKANLMLHSTEQTAAAPQLEATIQTMETAFKMQMEAPDVLDVAKESEATRKRYGDSSFARGCLMARRMVERGIRFVQVNHGDWDHHADILHLLGLNHERLTYPYSGRDFRLTDVEGRVIREILA